MEKFTNHPDVKSFTQEVAPLFQQPAGVELLPFDSDSKQVNHWASLFVLSDTKPPPPPPVYRICLMIIICLFCTLNVEVGLLDVIAPKAFTAGLTANVRSILYVSGMSRVMRCSTF